MAQMQGSVLGAHHLVLKNGGKLTAVTPRTAIKLPREKAIAIVVSGINIDPTVSLFAALWTKRTSLLLW